MSHLHQLDYRAKQSLPAKAAHFTQSRIEAVVSLTSHSSIAEKHAAPFTHTTLTPTTPGSSGG